jgi:TPR repeat protein
MTRDKSVLTALLAGLAYDSGASAKARKAAEELYERAQYDLGAKILPLVKELHETRDIIRFIAQVSVWIAQPGPAGGTGLAAVTDAEVLEAASRLIGNMGEAGSHITTARSVLAMAAERARESSGRPEDPAPQEPDEDTAVLWLMLAMPGLSRDRATAAVRAAARYVDGDAREVPS